VWLFVLVLLFAFSTAALGGFRYQAGHWPAAVPAAVVTTAVPAQAPPAVDPAASGYLRSVVAINVRGNQGNRTGSGFLMDGAGHVVTVAHVVEGATCTTVFDDDGRAHMGTVVGRDRNLDIALLSVPTLASWPGHLELGSLARVKPKDPLFVLGSPKGAGNAVTLDATLSRTGVSQTTEDGHYYANLVQFDGAAVREGTSGGPLVDKASGKVIGVVTAASSSPVAYAIPVDDVAGLFRQWAALKAPSCTAGPAAQTVPVSLAAILPFSGAYGVEGADLAAGVNLALKDMEPALLAAGYTVSLKTYDDQSTPERGRDAAATAVYDPKVIGVVGSLEGQTTAAIARALEPGGLVMVSPTAGLEDLTTHGWSHFNRLVASAWRQEQAAAKFAKERLKSKAVFIVDDGSPEAARQLFNFKQAAQIIALPVAGTYKLPGNWDYAEVKKLITDAKADAVYYAGGSEAVLRLAQQLRQDGFFMPILGGQALLDPRFERMNKVGDRGIYFTRLTAEPSEPFKRYFERSVGKPTRYGAYGYDAAGVILSALLRYGEVYPGKLPPRQELKRLVRETNGFSGWSSQVTFDGTGENLSSWIYVYEWKQGVPEYRDYLK
jgi:branched-chain amino acid transport system substrate-binding protein